MAVVDIFVPRWTDRTNTNAQNSNATAMLSRFSDRRVRWTAVCNEPPTDTVTGNGVQIVALSRSRLWKSRLVLAYQGKFDAIFYPGPYWWDEAGLKLRHLCGRRVPLIATMEGIITDRERIQQLSNRLGHPVFSQPGADHAVPRVRRIYEMADHIIAISPFLARVGKFLYGDKVSYLPLGLEGQTFNDAGQREPARCRVVGCGTVKSSKNPQMFVHLAKRYPAAEFVWFGDGPSVPALTARAKELGLENLAFPGPVQPDVLAEEFRHSSIFVLPSHAEGAPKVVQEAAACGLPVVLNGFYEAPSVVHGQNGLVAWSDEELTDQVGTLVGNAEIRRRMGQRSAEMAREWDWDRIAPQWEDLVIRSATA